MSGTTTAVTDYLYNASLAIRHLRERPDDRLHWQTAFDRLGVFTSSCGGWKLVSPLIKTLATELPRVATTDPRLAMDASAGLFVISTRFSQSDASFLAHRLVRSHVRYSAMNENNIKGHRELWVGYSEPDSIKAVEHFEKAGRHFLRSGFAMGALYSFTHANRALLCSFGQANQALLFSADALSSTVLLKRQAAVRSNLELARGLALSTNVSTAYAETNLKFNLSGIVLDPPAGSTPAGLTDGVRGNQENLN